MAKRVRVGAKYVFTPVMFDTVNPPFNVKPGDIVTVVNLLGCPKANTMGMCHVAKDGKFAGMVCTNSLDLLRNRRDGVPHGNSIGQPRKWNE